MQEAEFTDQSPQQRHLPAPAVSHESVRAHLQKVVASRTFAASALMCEFLTFAVEHALGSPSDRFKENVIGSEVFGRDPQYDPQTDPMVRVEARRPGSTPLPHSESEGRE